MVNHSFIDCVYVGRCTTLRKLVSHMFTAVYIASTLGLYLTMVAFSVHRMTLLSPRVLSLNVCVCTFLINAAPVNDAGELTLRL